MQEEKLDKLKKSVQNIHNIKGKISTIYLNEKYKNDLKHVRKSFSYKCYLKNIGFFSFVIKYKPEGEDYVYFYLT